MKNDKVIVPIHTLTVGDLINILSQIDKSAKICIGYDYDGKQTSSDAVIAEFDKNTNEVIIADKWY